MGASAGLSGKAGVPSIPMQGSQNPYALPGQTTSQQQFQQSLTPKPQTSPGSDIVIGPGPAPTAPTGTAGTSAGGLDSAMLQALASLGSGLFGMGMGMGQNNSPTNDQATLPNYLQSPYDNGMYNGSPMAQALNQYAQRKA